MLKDQDKINRRTFLKSAAAVSALTILKPETVFRTAANSAIRMGIIGCGDRGTGVLTAMSATASIEIIALADLFDDKLLLARKAFNRYNAKKGFAEIQEENIYQGSKAYLRLLDAPVRSV